MIRIKEMVSNKHRAGVGKDRKGKAGDRRSASAREGERRIWYIISIHM